MKTDQQLQVRSAAELERVQQIDVAQVVRDVIMAAKDPAVDADKAQTMMNMVLQLQDRQARQLFVEAKARVQTKMPRISPHGAILNSDGSVRSRYSKYEDIDLFLRPILATEGLCVSFDDGVIVGNVLNLSMTVSHIAGHSVTVVIPMALANIPGTSEPQKTRGTMSFAKRAGVTNYFNVVTEGIDNDAQGHESEPLTPNQLDVLQSMIDRLGVRLAGFMKLLAVSDLGEITQGKVPYICNALRVKLAGGGMTQAQYDESCAALRKG